jgi:hypothetical protein
VQQPFAPSLLSSSSLPPATTPRALRTDPICISAGKNSVKHRVPTSLSISLRSCLPPSDL